MSKTAVLISSDDVWFEVDEMFGMESGTVKSYIDYGCVNGGLSLRVTGNILSKVIDFCNKHAQARITHEDLKDFDSEFLKVDHTTLVHLIRVSFYLGIKSLLPIACKTLVDMITGKTTEEILGIFNIENDLTLDEMESARNFYPWAFD